MRYALFHSLWLSLISTSPPQTCPFFSGPLLLTWSSDIKSLPDKKKRSVSKRSSTNPDEATSPDSEKPADSDAGGDQTAGAETDPDKKGKTTCVPAQSSPDALLVRYGNFAITSVLLDCFYLSWVLIPWISCNGGLILVETAMVMERQSWAWLTVKFNDIIFW